MCYRGGMSPNPRLAVRPVLHRLLAELRALLTRAHAHVRGTVNFVNIASASGALPPPGSAVPSPLDQAVDQRRIGQRRGITEAAELVLRDLPQDPPHDLARPGLRQSRSEVDD